MTRFIILAAFISSFASAQDVPPPPKPKDDGPSLADTMKFIEEKLGAVGPVNYVNYYHDNANGHDWMHKVSYEIEGVESRRGICWIDYHFRYSRDGESMGDGGSGFWLKDVQELVVMPLEQSEKENQSRAGNPEWAVRVDPPVFLIRVKRQKGEDQFPMYDETLANRVAKAMNHAVELCGGGSKDPF